MKLYVEILDDIEASLEDLSDFVDLCRRGLRYPAQAAEIATIVKKQAGSRPKRLRTMIAKMAETSGRAQRHIDAEFAYLFGTATVQLWTVLEATVMDFVLAFLEDGGRWKAVPLTSTVKLTVAEFAGLADRQQLETAFDAALMNRGTRNQPGIGRFENLLKEVGLGGDVPDEVRRTILWLAETRHVLLHRKGIADNKYLDRCPWTGLGVGTRITVRESDFNAARRAVRAYMALLGLRLEKGGHDRVRHGRAASLARTLAQLRAQPPPGTPSAASAP